jgi:hypothetical protein
MDAEKIAAAVIAALPDLLKALGAIVALCKRSGATDEQIREALEPAERAEIKRIKDQQDADEQAELDRFRAAAARDLSDLRADPLTAEGAGAASDGSSSLRS